MKNAPRTISLLLLLALAACSNGKIPLAYNFEEGDGTRYRWTIDSRTSVNSSSEQSVTTTSMVVDVHEQVSGEAKPVLTITLKPTSLTQGGSPIKTPAATTVQYELNDRGEILKAVTDELAAPAASAVQLGATLIRSRIALPPGPVGIGDEWEAPLVLDGDLGNIQLDGHGKLVGFELKGKRKLARIETTRTGDIVTHQQQGGVPVRLRGTSTTEAMSSLDVDNGVLYSSSARLISDFDIASQESGKLIGTMQVTLNSRLQLAPQQA